MSCGKLHEAGDPFHFHAPGHEHDGDHEADPELQPEDGEPGELEAVTPAPGWIATAGGHVKTAAAGAWAQHGYAVKPFLWLIGGAEGSEWLIEQVYGGDWARALAAAAVMTAAAEGATEVTGHRHRTPRSVRAKNRAAIGVAGVAMAVGGAGVFDWWTAAATGLAGLFFAGRITHEKWKTRPKATFMIMAPEPPVIEAPAGPDTRLTQFADRFCQPGKELDGVTAEAFRETTNGFMFELDFTGTAHSPEDAAKLEVAIAKLYNIRRTAVSVDYVPGPARSSENYCQVEIRRVPLLETGEQAKPKVRPWDIQSTWNPEAGTVDLGWFTDDLPARYLFHMPRSGAAMGMVAGMMGAGKTGTINVLACEAGLAKLCRACGYARECGACQLERVMAVWMGDAQGQGLTVWEGRADLMGTGPEGCVELLELANQVATARAKARRTMQWADIDQDTGKRRFHTGKGWYDVEIGWPLIFLVMDEFQKLVRRDPDSPFDDPQLRNTVQRIAVSAVTEWRKVGIHLLIGTPALDTTLTGRREIRDLIKGFNSIGHRADEVTSNLGGITGDPTRLPKDIKGAGYISGIDDRPGSQFATKYLGEIAKPGERYDVAHVAAKIADTPIEYDDATRGVLDAWKIPDRHVFDTWYGRPKEAGPSEPVRVAAQVAATVPPQAPAAQPRLASVPAATADPAVTEAVRKCLQKRSGAWRYTELMKETSDYLPDNQKASLGDIRAVAAALAASGEAVLGDKQIQAA